MKSSDGAPKLERKTVEKNRRIQMKNLIFKLSSLIPDDHKFPSKDALTQQDYLDQTTSYIKHMKQKIQRLKQRKDVLTGDLINNQERISKHKFPMVEIRQRDSSLEVVMISKESKQSVFYEVMSVLEEEGAEVINASSSVVGDKVFHTIHCHELCSTVGLNAYKIYEILEGLLAGISNGSEVLSNDM